MSVFWLSYDSSRNKLRPLDPRKWSHGFTERYAIIRDFFVAVDPLSQQNRNLVERRLLSDLARRVPFWLGFLLIACIGVWDFWTQGRALADCDMDCNALRGAAPLSFPVKEGHKAS